MICASIELNGEPRKIAFWQIKRDQLQFTFNNNIYKKIKAGNILEDKILVGEKKINCRY
jgi:hypothetical protein